MKTVLVTGGVRGIGLSIALAFLKKKADKRGEEYRVAVSYSKDEESAAEARRLGLEVYKADVANGVAVRELFSKLGRVDVLVNNAGVSLIKQIQDVTDEEFDWVFGVNVKGAFLCSREAAKSMIARGKGLIVNISSVGGEVGGSCESVYSASKAALIGFTKALSKEFAGAGVRVNCVSPGVIKTAMNERFSADELLQLAEEIPLGRLGGGDDVAGAVLFLEENEYVTGVDLPVGGGFAM